MVKNLYCKVIFIFIFFIFSFFCTHNKNGWRGTIEEANGITIINNPKEPMYGDNYFSFKEELTIGETEGSEKYIFSDIRSLAVSEDEKIFVLDTKECHIKVFDGQGQYLWTIGKRGQGPGEMQMPMSIQITPQEEVMVNDSEKLQIQFFSCEGEFIRSVSTAEMRNFIGPKVDYYGNIIASYNIPGPTMKSVLKKFNMKLDPKFLIHTLKLFELPIMNPFFPELFWQVAEDSNIVWGISTEYTINILNSEGELIKKISRNYDPVEITDKDKKEKLLFLFGNEPVPSGLRIKWPKYNWAVNDICIDDNGNVIIGIFKNNGCGSGYCYDVFDFEGKYIAKIKLQAKPQVWKKDKLYTIEQDKEGYQLIKRYRVEIKSRHN